MQKKATQSIRSNPPRRKGGHISATTLATMAAASLCAAALVPILSQQTTAQPFRLPATDLTTSAPIFGVCTACGSAESWTSLCAQCGETVKEDRQ